MNLPYTPFPKSDPTSRSDFPGGALENIRQPRLLPVNLEGQCGPGRGFTLVEMLVVMAVIVTIMTLILPIVRGIKGAGDLTASAYDISGTLQGARSFAIAHNTYTWVGFYEENSSSFTATNVPPSYPGIGRVVVACVASIDGTTIADDSILTSTATSLDQTRITVINKVLKLEGIHLVDIGPPPDSPAPNLPSYSLDLRSGLPYLGSDPTQAAQNRISSESPLTTTHPFAAGGYTFYKAVRFNPRGEAIIPLVSTASTFRRVAEIGLRPTRGTVVDSNSPNAVAIQFTGVSGSVKIYRR